MPKKLINTPSNAVPECIEGLLATNSGLKKVEGFNVVVRSDIPTDKVTLISGGGSGHEPAHAGYIGKGMLTGAALGNVFASPSVAAVLATIRCCASPKGVLVIVKNYTGDRLNFGMAIEKARAEGINARMLVVEDDCALEPGKGITGGRGVAGTVFVHKIAGACAERGMSLDEVHSAASTAASSMGTMGCALTPCNVPGATVSSASESRLAGKTVEVGMGIHGEPGRETMDLPDNDAADVLSDIMLEAIIGSESAPSRLALNSGDKVALMVNNLGATPLLELLIVARRVSAKLKERGIILCRAYVGNFMTSLEMGGVSISLLKTEDTELSLLDDNTNAPAWVPSTILDSGSSTTVAYNPNDLEEKVRGGAPVPGAVKVLRAICERLVSIEPVLTEYDTICGDGDCGIVMKAGATGVLNDLSELEACESDSATFCSKVADSVSNSMGGTSGALIELALRAMAAYFQKEKSADWGNAIAAGVQAMQFYGGATTGMRTMLDALVPASDILQEKSIADAAAAAVAGAETTKTMASLAGRSNYIDSKKMEGVPDPGAWAMSEAFQAAANILQN